MADQSDKSNSASDRPKNTLKGADGRPITSSGSKREREIARAKAERQAARRVEQTSKRKRRQQIIGAVTVTALVLSGTAWAVLSNTTSTETDASINKPIDILPSASAPASTDAPTAPASVAPSGDASASSAPSAPASASATASSTTAALKCTDPVPSRPDNLSWPTAPDAVLDAKKTYTITYNTNCGPIKVQMVNSDKAPKTTAAMNFLATEKFWDATKCHRLTTEGIYVLQCGDPKGDGSGGPGFQIPDENLPAEGANNYPAGTVAMANAGPGTSGSQFFLVYEDTTLGPNYTIWGTITEGLDIVKAIAAEGGEGGAPDGAPKQPITITTATVSS